MKSIYSRQFATMAGMVLLSFLMLGASFSTLSYQYTMQEKQETLVRNANYIADYTAYEAAKSGGYVWMISSFRQYLSTVAKVADAHIMVTTNDGQVVYATDGVGELSAMEGAVLSDGVVAQASRGTYTDMTDLDGLYGRPRYVVGLPVARLGMLQGLVFLSSDVSNITAMWRNLSGIFVMTAVAVILIAAVLSSATSFYQSKPMKEIAAAARQFGHGELGVRVHVGNRKDEVGELAEAFNAMADSLAKSEQRRTEFVANVSHELKTPMTTIAGFADGILDGTIPPEKQRQYLQVISSETRRLSRLVRSMLDLSRLQSDERAAQQQFDIGETMLRVLVSLESKINAKHLEVDAQLPDQPEAVWGDQDAITQVCYNLLDNAIKFSRDGGKLTVSITARGQKVYTSITNQGQTIPEEELPLIFDRFHKADHSRSADRDGVGLGLYIVKTILNSHKENVTCTSGEGETTFTFTLTRA
ncbi:MAG TPA: sensor histidine kinase [Clostridiales bacterium]|nr:sensor histidine kinase [Clostridiales bacterium]